MPTLIKKAARANYVQTSLSKMLRPLKFTSAIDILMNDLVLWVTTQKMIYIQGQSIKPLSRPLRPFLLRFWQESFLKA